ncbi:hypothetical protein KOR42_41500 [Thalassoglobus neptunius]|uniref:Uncharacterized protein n=1 Tax=Thalassoglobus neptunius TaxID=1938619 RepID=A0A5C5WBY0_9PLAN|nr:hypothetical protein KOR42_41500 [Thalassoglobus neptunius]
MRRFSQWIVNTPCPVMSAVGPSRRSTRLSTIRSMHFPAPILHAAVSFSSTSFLDCMVWNWSVSVLTITCETPQMHSRHSSAAGLLEHFQTIHQGTPVRTRSFRVIDSLSRGCLSSCWCWPSLRGLSRSAWSSCDRSRGCHVRPNNRRGRF